MHTSIAPPNSGEPLASQVAAGTWPARSYLPTSRDFDAIGIWIASRIAVFLLAYGASWRLGPFSEQLRSIPDQWNWFDASIYLKISADRFDPPATAFLPLFPMLMKWIGATGIGAIYAGLLVSLIAGTVAAVLLRRVADEWGFDGRWAVAALATAPMTVFMSAPYTAAPFLALALAAWLSARECHWWLMGILTSAMVLTRINGIFVSAGLVVLLATRRAPLRAYAWLALPAAAIGSWVLYLHTFRGDWLEYLTAQHAWLREFTGPVAALERSLTAAIRPCSDQQFCWYSTNEMFMARMELLAALVMVITVVWLALRRSWPDFAYVVLTMSATMTSSWYLSLPRFLLVLWPVAVLAGLLLARYTAVRYIWAALSLPLASLWVVAYEQGLWAG